MSNWNSNAPKADVLKAADDLEQELDKLPNISGHDSASHARHRAAVADLRTTLLERKTNRPTTCKIDWNGGVFKLHGFRATSTAGLPGAIRNWIRQVREKAGAA